MGKIIILIFILLPAGASQLMAAEPLTDTIRHWQQRYREDRTNDRALFNLGVAFHKAKKYKKALKAYRLVIRRKSPFAVVAHYYRAKIFDKFMELDKVQQEIELALALDPPAKLIRRMEQLLPYDPDEKVPDQSLDESPSFSGGLTYQAGSNSNPAFESLSDFSGDPPDQQHNGTLYLDYEWHSTDRSQGLIGTNQYGLWFENTSSEDFQSSDIFLQWSQYWQDFRWRLRPRGAFEFYSGAPFSLNWETLTDISWKWNTHYLIITMDYKRLIVQDGDFAYLSGDIYIPSLSWQFRPGAHLFQVDLLNNNFIYGDLNSNKATYRGYTLRLGYSYFWETWSVFLQAAYETRQFEKAEGADQARQDERLSSMLQINYNLSRFWQLQAVSTYTDNQSNFNDSDDDQVFFQWTANLGISTFF